uniref:Queuosine 5'-phosphate N-glycosylase/hydrolase n=1 Tax=Setaria digitata TaxID=48799 RepID=A0A915PZZ5_9BILA
MQLKFQQDMSIFADRLYPRESAEFIVANSNGDIELCQEGVLKVSELIMNTVNSGDFNENAYFSIDVHPQTPDRKAIDWIFLIDTINFSFWSDEKVKFQVTFHGKKYTGYLAACACINRALEENIPITNATYMENLTAVDARRIFKTDDGDEIPLLQERVKVINEAGRVLNQFRSSSVHKFLLVTYICAWERMMMHATSMTSSRHLSFFCELTMFADYRVPQALHFLGVLKYSSVLMERLHKKELLQNGSECEVEIRGFSIKACDAIAKEIRQKAVNINNSEYNATYVDIFLWLYRRKNAKEIEETVPFHRTRCIYY